MDIDIDKPLEPQIRRGLVAELAGGIGYVLESERLDRVSDGMGSYMQGGFYAIDAFFESLDDELLLYGDPTTPRQHFVPLTWLGRGV